jgi:hypothetical protein
LLQNSISKSPIIFLKLAENTVGEYDLFLTPRMTAESQSYFLNWTYIDGTLSPLPTVTGTSARSAILAKIGNARERSKNVSVIALVIDSKQEETIGLGREWSHPPLQENHIHLSLSAIRAIGIQANHGDTVNLTVDALNLLSVSGCCLFLFYYPS